MSYMFGWIRRRKDDTESADLKFRGAPKNFKPYEEPPPAYVPPLVVEEPAPVPILVESSGGPTIFETIFVKIKKDRLTRWLLALLLGILLLLLLLSLFAFPGGKSPFPDGFPPIGSASCGVGISSGGTSVPKEVKIGDGTVCVRQAITNDEQLRGLRFTPTLKTNEGMIYIFSQPDRYPFWAKDMQYPMDIIFISSGNRVSDIKTNLPPCTESCPIYTPSSPISYAIEVNGGWVDRNLVDIGDPVAFIY